MYLSVHVCAYVCSMCEPNGYGSHGRLNSGSNKRIYGADGSGDGDITAGGLRKKHTVKNYNNNDNRRFGGLNRLLYSMCLRMRNKRITLLSAI